MIREDPRGEAAALRALLAAAPLPDRERRAEEFRTWWRNLWKGLLS